MLPPLYGERLELALDRLEADRLSGIHPFQGFLVFHDDHPVNNHMHNSRGRKSTVCVGRIVPYRFRIEHGDVGHHAFLHAAAYLHGL